MTSPDGAIPSKAVTYDEISAMQNYDPDIAAGIGNSDVTGLANLARGNLLTNILGGFIGGIAQLISTLFSGIFGGSGGGILDLIGGLLGVKNDVNQIVNVDVPRLDNRIDEVSVGGVSASRAFFGQSGTWTKPAGDWSRHVIDVIGGGSGGGRGDSFAGDNGIGGWVGGWAQEEFFDSDLPSTLPIVVGIGGAGATTNGAQGGNGGESRVTGYLAAGGGTGSYSGAVGFGSKTILIRGGNGGRDGAAASAGTGHTYAAGGLAGTPVDSGNPGGSGNTPTPSTKAYPGTGGGGGADEGTIGQPGGNGGNGGYPGGPGGGGGAPGFNGARGNGGNGAAGGVWITSFK